MIRRLLRKALSRQAADPDPPRNVRLLCEDGDVVPVELVYAGQQRGLSWWVSPYAILYREGMRMMADYMPAKSYVHVWLRFPDGDVREWEDVS